ncbi:MAG TPA: hypothetical protein VMR52_12225 [Dehalococcoidia bacterium]|nr:hypothetical protein [Dehalococcoidia bacterium]
MSEVIDDSARGKKGRRQLLAMAGAGGVAAMAAVLGHKNGAEAGHDATNVLHLGEVNSTPLDGGLSGRTDVGTNTDDFGFSISNAGTGEAAGGLYVTGQGGKPVIEADILEGEGPAVQGVAGAGETFGQGTGIGVQGISGSGPGVQGISGSGSGADGTSDSGIGVSGGSQDGPGVRGDSQNGPGGEFNSQSGPGVSAYSPGGTGAAGFSDTGFGVEGFCPAGPGVKGHSDTANGTEGVTNTGIGVLGRSDSGDAVVGHSQSASGVFGFSGVAEEDILTLHGFGASGVQGVNVSGDGFGVSGFGPTGVIGEGRDAGVLGIVSSSPADDVNGNVEQAGVRGDAVGCTRKGPCEPGIGIGVHGRSEAGTGVRAEVLDPAGIALDVIGKARFSTAGAGAVPQSAASAFVANEAVQPNSHVSVTLTGDPGKRQLNWVEIVAGGFNVHMTDVPPPQRTAVDFTYLVVEPPA